MDFLNKKLSIFFALLILIFAIGGGLVWRFALWEYLPQWRGLEATSFIASTEKIEGNSIYTEGVFDIPNHPEFYQPDKRVKMRVDVTSGTEYVKILLYMPTLEELKKTGGRWNPNELKKEEVQGSFDDIKPDGMPLKITTEKSIFKRTTSFKAKKIEYIKELYPDRPF